MRKTIQRFFSENLVLKLVSLLSAILLWLVILNIDDPINSRSFSGIPVTVQNESVITNSGMIYQIENGTNLVSVKVTGRRSVLSRIRQDQIEAIADMNDLSLDKLVPIRVRVNGFEGTYDSAVATPNNLQITIEKNGTVRLPVSVTTIGNLAENCFVESTSVSPSTLVISGPESQVEKINSVVLRVDVSSLNATETLTGTLLYYDKNGDAIDRTGLSSSVDEADIYVTVKILPVKEVPIEVSVEGTPAEGYEFLGVNCEPKTVPVIGKADALDQIEKVTIESQELNIDGADTSLETVCDLSEFLPEGISLADGTTDKIMIMVRIERAGTSLIEYPTGSVIVEHAPIGYRIGYDLTELKLEFSGSIELLEKMQSDDIRVMIDLAQCTREGKYEVPITVEVPEGVTLEKPSTLTVNLAKE